MYFKNILQKIISKFKPQPATIPVTQVETVVKKVIVKNGKECIIGEYKVSPYSKHFTPPKHSEYAYQSIETVCGTEDRPVEYFIAGLHEPEEIYEEVNNIDYTETVSKFKPETAESEIKVEPEVKPKKVDKTPKPNYPINKNKDEFFVMNGYGILVKLSDGNMIETYLDTGRDYDLKKDQKVKLFASSEKYMGQIGVIVEPLNKERKGLDSEILIQSVYDIETDVKD